MLTVCANEKKTGKKSEVNKDVGWMEVYWVWKFLCASLNIPLDSFFGGGGGEGEIWRGGDS